jgi:hypothetical protein
MIMARNNYKSHILLCCIMKHHHQNKANGLKFMLVPKYGRFSFLFIYRIGKPKGEYIIRLMY